MSNLKVKDGEIQAQHKDMITAAVKLLDINHYDWYYGSPQTHGKPTTKSESVSDLVVCLPLGHYLYAECKVGNDCLTPRQTAFKLKIEKHGGWYITFSTAEELLPQVKKFLGVVQYTHKAHTHNKPIHA